MSHIEEQRQASDVAYSQGSRQHTTTSDVLVNYIVRKRINDGIRYLIQYSTNRLTYVSSILLLCSGEGLEGTVLADMGFTDVTVSDISDVAVKGSMERDKRLHGIVINAENTRLEDGSFDVVIVQDGLHHLQNPILGFTEMLRISRLGVLFIEGHDSFIGNVFGTEWERHGDAVNYVFRWKRKLVRDLAKSYLGPDSFSDHSYAFWHHNIVYARIGNLFGGGKVGLKAVAALDFFLNHFFHRIGNSFCCLIVKS
jgi:SAM-dependent methyltransferase